MAASTATFAAGRQVHLLSSHFDATVLALIGSGGQGTVYRADVLGSLHAVKWYHQSYLAQDPRLRTRLSEAISRGTPDDRFLWPIELVEADAEKSFGYLMLFRPPNFRSSRSLLGPANKRLKPSLAVRTMACLNIAECFLKLHAAGFCYQDVSSNNVFFDPASGAIRICDNDNVDVNGKEAVIYGTRKFMAPEIVRREALPSTATDLFSMAVLFFYLLHSWHPLEGRRDADATMLDADDELKFYGTDPRFIFHPTDDSNGPVPGMHDSVVRRWKSLSEAIRKIIITSFTAGLDPAKRVVETRWLTAFSRMNDSLVSCPHCGYEHALSLSSENTTSAPSFACVACNSPIPVPPRLVIDRDSIVLAPQRVLYRHHLTVGNGYRFDKAEALVQPRPDNPAILGLQNLSHQAWSVKFPDGRSTTVPPEKSVRIRPGLTIDFGNRRGQIVA